MSVIVIGGGPSGMMAAIQAKEQAEIVTLIEKNDVLGKKLNITGKGRCNITYKGNNEYFLQSVVTNPKFLMSAINIFNNQDLINFLETMNIKTKEERGNRVFLESDNAKDLTEALKRELKKRNIKIIYNAIIKEIIVNKDNKVEGIRLENGEKIAAHKVILTTGGKSYPSTGSTGDGYNLAEKLGHTIISPKPALVAFKLYEENICKSIEGLALKNVNMKVKEKDKTLDERFGELLFTSRGISGPIVLSSSSIINKDKELDEKARQKNIQVIIDLKPALQDSELYKRVTRDYEKYTNKEFKNSLKDLLPSSIIPIIIDKTKIDPNKKVNAITKEEKLVLVSVLKSLVFNLKGLENISTGIVTSGGINTKEINPKTMESKLVKGLYFAGEIIDVDAITGGFNLQIAFSTGYVAGRSAGEEIE